MGMRQSPADLPFQWHGDATGWSRAVEIEGKCGDLVKKRWFRNPKDQTGKDARLSRKEDTSASWGRECHLQPRWGLGEGKGGGVAAVPKMQPFQADPSVGLGEGAIDISPKLDAAWNAGAAVCPGLWRAKSMHDWIERGAMSVEA